MKARIRRLSASVDSPTIIIDQSSSNTEDSSHRVTGSDGSSPSESRIDRMKKLLSSPLSRRKSSSSSSNITQGTGSSARTFGATLSSLAYQDQEQDQCPSLQTSSLHASTVSSTTVPTVSSTTVSTVSSTAVSTVSTVSSTTVSTVSSSMTVSHTETSRFLSASSNTTGTPITSLSMDIPTSDPHIPHMMSTLSPNVSFDTSSLSPSPPMTSSTHPLSSRTHPLSSRTHPLNSRTHPLNSRTHPLSSRIGKQPGIPFIISRLCNFIESNSGLTFEGLFRVSGNVKLVEKLKNSFDTFGDAPLESIGDVPSAAALIKLFLRELPEPVIPTTAHRSFLDVVKDPAQLTSNREKSLERLKALIDTKLPAENYYILKYLSSFLYQVSLNESSNRMNCGSLGIVFGPNIFRLSADDYKDLKDQAISGPNILVSTFISDHEFLFSSTHHPLGSTSVYSSLSCDSTHHPLSSTSVYSSLSCDVSSGQTSTIDPASIPSSSFDCGSVLKGERFSSLLDERIKLEEISVSKSGQHIRKKKTKKSSSFDTQMSSNSIDSCKLFSGPQLSSSTDDSIRPKKMVQDGSKKNKIMVQDGSKKNKYGLPRIIPLLTLSKTDESSSSIFGSSKHRFGGKKRKETTTGSSTPPCSSCCNIPSDVETSTLLSGVETSTLRSNVETSTLGRMMMTMSPPIHAELLRSCSEERASPSPVLGQSGDSSDPSAMRRCKSSEAVLKLSLLDSNTSSGEHSQDAGQDDDISVHCGRKGVRGESDVALNEPKSQISLTVTQPTSQTVSQPTSQTVTQPTSQTVTQESKSQTSQTVTQHVSETVTQPTSQTVTQLTEESSVGSSSRICSMSPELLMPVGSVDDFTSSHDSLASCSLLDDFMNVDPDRRKSSDEVLGTGRRKSSDEVLGTKRKNSLKSQKLESYPTQSPPILRPSSIDRVKRMEKIKKSSEQLPDLVLICGEPNNNDQGKCEENVLDAVTSSEGRGEEERERSLSVEREKSLLVEKERSLLVEREKSLLVEREKSLLVERPLIDTKSLFSPLQNTSLDILHRNSWPGATRESHSPVREDEESHKGRESMDSNASNEESEEGKRTVNNSYPLTNTIVNQLKMSENNPFEAPTSPSAFRAYLALRSQRLADPSSAPSPPVDHQFNRQQQFGSTSSKYSSSSLIVKEAKRRVSSLKRDLKDFETSFERKFGSKPTHEEKMNSSIAKPLLFELGKLRKGLKEMKEDHSIHRQLLDLEVTSIGKNISSEGVEADHPSHGCSSSSTCPFLSSFIRSHNKKSPSGRRSLKDDDIDFLPLKSPSKDLSPLAVNLGSDFLPLAVNLGSDLSPLAVNLDSDLLVESFNELQVTLRSKRLLAGRPETVDGMTNEQVMAEKVDLQRALLKFESTYGRPSTKQERDIMRPIYDRYRLVKRVVARMPKTATSVVVPITSGSDSDLQPILENVVMSFEPTVPSGGAQGTPLTSPKSDRASAQGATMAENPSSSFHELSLMELLSELNESRVEKKKLRRSIKAADEDFSRKFGRKMGKDDRSEQVQTIYNEYKHIKGKLRLLEALVLKREKSSREKSYV